MFVLPFVMLLELLVSGFIGMGLDLLSPTPLSLFFIAVNSIVFFLESAYLMKKSKTLYTIISVSYVFRLLFLFFDVYFRDFYTLPGSGADTNVFHIQAVEYAKTGQEGITNYVSFLGTIYRFTGSQRILGQYVNVVLSMLTLYLLIYTLRKLLISEQIIHIAVFILAFLPNYMIESAILLRESLLIFLLAFSLYLFVTWWTENRFWCFLLSIAFSLLAAYYHSGAIANSVVYVMAYILCGNRGRNFVFNVKSVALSLVFFAVFMVLFNQYGGQFFDYFASVESADDIVARNELAQSGGAAYTAELVSNDSFWGMLINTPLKMFYFLFSPLPWDWRNLNDVIAFVFSSLFFLFCLILGVRALRVRDYNRNFLWILLLLAIASAVIFGWGTSNAGTALRHRDKFLVNYIVMFAVSYHTMVRAPMLRCQRWVPQPAGGLLARQQGK